MLVIGVPDPAIAGPAPWACVSITAARKAQNRRSKSWRTFWRASKSEGRSAVRSHAVCATAPPPGTSSADRAFHPRFCLGKAAQSAL